MRRLTECDRAVYRTFGLRIALAFGLMDLFVGPVVQVRSKRMPEAMTELEAAARLAPESARYGYVYAVALNETGRPKPAMEAFLRVLTRHPYDRETPSALIAYSREQKNPSQALIYARRLAGLDPANMEARQLVDYLEAETRR